MKASQGRNETAGLVDQARNDQDVLAIVLFGSRARGDGEVTSDLDICLVLEPSDYSDLELSHKRLEYLGLFSTFNLDIQVYQQLPLYIKIRILKEGTILFCRDEDSLYSLAFSTVQQFEDFRRTYYSYLEAVGSG